MWRIRKASASKSLYLINKKVCFSVFKSNIYNIMDFIKNHTFHYFYWLGGKIITVGLSLQQNKVNSYLSNQHIKVFKYRHIHHTFKRG